MRNQSNLLPISRVLEKKPMESKKFILAALAVSLFGLVWAASFIAVLCKPEVAQHIVSLATLMSGVVTLVAGAGITGQSFIDLKATSQISNSNTAETRDEHVEKFERIEHVYEEGRPDSPERRPWSQHTTEEA